jgi:dTDP-4-dehydrorhamnose 3,5-epimerase
MPSHEAGIRWDDPLLNIPWPIPNPIVSDKDSKLPFLEELSLEN